MPLVQTLHIPVPRESARRARRPQARLLRSGIKSLIWQGLALVGIGGLLIYLGHNVSQNLQARGLASGFDFLGKEAGFAIGFSLIPFAETDTYGRAFLVGLINTALVAVVSMALATVLGILIGIARVSRHPPTAAAAAAYVEGWRNIPLLLQVLFWHQLLVNALPAVRQSLSVGGWIFLNNRGLVLPRFAADSLPVPSWLLLFGLAVTLTGLLWAALGGKAPSRSRQAVAAALAALLGLEILAVVFGLAWTKPELAGFNFEGGFILVPEFVALVVALVIYNAAFVAEIVRAGIEAVGKGQREAAAALGLTSGLIMRLVVLPQALRVIIPPLANQYSHMLKASSLATVIGYPDLVNVFLGTTLNQTGRAVEIVALTMAVFLVLSALVAAFTSWFNRRIAIVER